MRSHVPRHSGRQVERDDSNDAGLAPFVFELLSPYQRAIFTALFLPHLTVGQRAAAAAAYEEALNA